MGSNLQLYFTDEPKSLDQTLRRMGFRLDNTVKERNFRIYDYFEDNSNVGFTLWDWGSDLEKEVLEDLSKHLPSGLTLQYHLSMGVPHSPSDHLMRRFSQIAFCLKERYKGPILIFDDGSWPVKETSWREFYENWKKSEQAASTWIQEFHGQLRLIQVVARGLGHDIDVGLPD